MFEMTQYKARPLSNCVVKKPNIIGIIHSIMRLVDACLGSTAGMVVTFCMRNMETPTRTGRIGVGSRKPRSSHRKELSRGTASFTRGSHEYSWPDRSTRLSGVDGSVARRDQNSPIQMGN